MSTHEQDGSGFGPLGDPWLEEESMGTGAVGTVVRPERKPAPRQDERSDELPPHAVVVHNDDLNTFEHVARCLKKVFGYPFPTGIKYAWEIHNTGRASVWVGPLEHAELKAEQIVSCGPTPEARDRGAQPLRVSVEPVED